MEDIDWTACPDVERIPGKVSGQWIVVGTRILADGVIVNAESGLSPEELANEHFPGLGVERARRIIAFAKQFVTWLLSRYRCTVTDDEGDDLTEAAARSVDELY